MQASIFNEISEPQNPEHRGQSLKYDIVCALQQEPAYHSPIAAIFSQPASADQSQVITNMHALVWTLDWKVDFWTLEVKCQEWIDSDRHVPPQPIPDFTAWTNLDNTLASKAFGKPKPIGSCHFARRSRCMMQNHAIFGIKTGAGTLES